MNKKTMKKNTKFSVRELPPYICFLGAICVVLMIITLISTIIIANREPKVEFIPPAFESDVVAGVPEVPQEYAYKEIYQAPMPFSASICGAVFNENGKAVVYFTNPKKNTAWLKLRICDENGNILGESGLLKPGEYVRAVSLNQDVAAGTTLKIKIMGYEPDTYMSVGAVNVNTVIQ